MNDVTTEDLVAADQGVAANSAKMLALHVPPAAEPLDPQLLTVLGQQTAKAYEHLSGGQMAVPTIAPVTEPTTQVPEDLASALVGLSHGLQQLGVERYAFDPAEMLRTNDGVSDLIGITGQLCYDKQVQRQMQGQQLQSSTSGVAPE